MKYEGIILTDAEGDTFAIEKLENDGFVMKATLTASGDTTILNIKSDTIRELRDWLTARLEKNLLDNKN
jgi:hypothetical protein